MAALDFPLNPTTTTEVTTGDITWKWNGYAWYAVSESDTDLDNIFLSKVNNDTAAGLITFEKLTTHEGGVLVTDDRVTIKSTRNSQALNILPANTAFSDNNLTIEDRSAGLITVGQNDCSVPANCGVAGLVADASLTNLITTATSRVAGIESGVNSVNNRNFYNFYASGTAPNYFAGITRVSGSPTDGVSPHLNSGSDQSGVEITTDAINIGSKNTSVSNEPLSINRYGSGIAQDAPWIGLYQAGIRRSYINCNGGTGTFMLDERAIASSEDITSATTVIQSITPKRVTDADGNQQLGFVAHELQEHFAEGVFGTKDATEAIGTYTDPDGVVTTDVTEPEAIAYGATWQQTGIRDVYQGVDQTKLIPLLTKALQEALDKIETLETRLNDAGIA